MSCKYTVGGFPNKTERKQTEEPGPGERHRLVGFGRNAISQWSVISALKIARLRRLKDYVNCSITASEQSDNPEGQPCCHPL